MPPFIRGRFTWLAYLMLGYYAYMQAAPGPLMSYLGDELQLGYIERGLHFSGFAFGMVLAGFTADKLAARWGRPFIFWVGGSGMAVAALILTLGQTPDITIFSTFLMGYIGSCTLVMIQATLADRHGDSRTIAITEANVIASVGAMLAPALVGILATNWRGALYTGLGAWILLFAAFRTASIPQNTQTARGDSTPSAKLPKVFWLYWVMGILIGSIEWSVIFWAADFFERVVGLPRNYAAAVVSAFFVANIIGRALGSRLARSMAAERLLLFAVIITAIGFPIFWLSTVPALNIAGLFLTGLGVSNLYPFMLSLVTRTAADQSNTASARISMAMGIAILVAPQVLASIADRIGIQSAYSVVVLLLGLLLFFTIASNRLSTRSIQTVNIL